ncbi:alpha/beta fold hydrolase [uncultured Draconibacterium sp.]|uniref:alpha/beta hydrolase family protein n=1 Tax=uncultured Draconibacterium sp. TaxID=1573823 RepID=UPI0029C6D2A7|nr:alpha/beta fold hydrolase [uncultured Draconibacterium sp.]
MKKILLFAIILVPFLIRAQDITGKWNGLLKVQNMELTLVFHISKEDSEFSTIMDSPDQKAIGIATSSTSFKNSTLIIEIAELGARYKGQYNDGVFEGTFYQVNQSFPLNLTTNEVAKKKLNRPQEPKKPYPYFSEEVSFPGGAPDVKLAGTLTIPKGEGPFAVAVLISGSGPQNRDEEFLTHKPFLVLSDYLTRKGIAVLRYDDRGFAASTGNHATATSEDFANDVRAAIAYLKTRNEIDQEHIGLIGHSEGGLIAPMVAATNTDLAFIVLLAGPGVPGDQILLKQSELIGKASGLNENDIQKELTMGRNIFELFHKYGESDSFEIMLREYLEDAITEENKIPGEKTKEEYIQLLMSPFKMPWYRYFISYDPAKVLRQVQCQVLALNGSLDVQVAPENLEYIEKAIKEGGNKKVTIKEYPNMNHLFQKCITGSLDEYPTIEQTIDPMVLNDISNWIEKQIK